VLEVDGVAVAQSSTQLRLIGRLGGLYPAGGAVAEALAESVVDQLGDVQNELVAIVYYSTAPAEEKVRATRLRARL